MLVILWCDAKLRIGLVWYLPWPAMGIRMTMGKPIQSLSGPDTKQRSDRVCVLMHNSRWRKIQTNCFAVSGRRAKVPVAVGAYGTNH